MVCGIGDPSAYTSSIESSNQSAMSISIQQLLRLSAGRSIFVTFGATNEFLLFSKSILEIDSFDCVSYALKNWEVNTVIGKNPHVNGNNGKFQHFKLIYCQNRRNRFNVKCLR